MFFFLFPIPLFMHPLLCHPSVSIYIPTRCAIICHLTYIALSRNLSIALLLLILDKKVLISISIENDVQLIVVIQTNIIRLTYL